MNPASLARRQRQKEALRNSILEAARQLFRQHDYSSVTLRKIAEQIEYSPTTIYLYFQDKHALVMELISEGFEELHRRMLSAQDSNDPVESMRRCGLEYLHFSQDQPHYYRLMFQLEDAELNARCRQQQERLSEKCFGFLMQLVGEVRQAHGLIPDESDLMIAHHLWSGLHGAATLALGGLLDRLPEADQARFFPSTLRQLLRSVLV